jgi:putative aldouronate transport system permease protein
VPILNIISSSFSSPAAVASGRVKLWPVEPSLIGYQAVFRNSQVWLGFKNSFTYVIIGTSINVAFTLLAAYPLSRKAFLGKGFFMFLFTFTMIFNGGLIPTYLVVRNLGMIDTRWAMLIPGAVHAYFIIIARTFLQSNIPHELSEAAELDGCNHFQFFGKILLPLAKPVIAVLVLMYAVGHWNQFFNALIYLRSDRLFPLQIFLREILVLNKFDATSLDSSMVDRMIERQFMVAVLKYSLIVVATAPIMALYPFIQKYFVKGVMIGSIKG